MKKAALPALIAGLLVSATTAPEAYACGGFFCSQVPVVQTRERIVFEVEGEIVTAYVQLQFQGDDEDFAWVVPVPEAPVIEVGVGDALFDALDAQTAPRFVNADDQPASAAGIESISVGCGSGGGASPPEPRLVARFIPTPDVTVWAAEQVGPYDVATISADDAEDLNDWLRVNGYRVVPGSDPIVQAYLDEGMKLVALKLAPEAGTNQIEPIKMTYADSRGCATIPIRLTAIAATPALEIVTWVFGSGRAVPENYGTVTVDPGDLASPADYGPALADAVDTQAGGHGFVTEYAQPTAHLDASNSEALSGLVARNLYITRLRTELDPQEMTIDPEFATDHLGEDVSNEIWIGGSRTLGASSSGALLVLGALLMFSRRRS